MNRVKRLVIRWAFSEICKAGLVGTKTINVVHEWLEE